MSLYCETELEEKVEREVKEDATKELILFNDDVHTFDFVIDALVKVCRHTTVQAEQSAYIVHFNGKCSIKRGSEKKLRPMKDALIDRELIAKIY